jgi:Sec-independent protein translocase protein TatA
MDGLVAGIISGVVVTVVGAIVAFYLGGVREHQKQQQERQREEQKQQEERQREEQKQQEERQEDLNKQRAEALRGIWVQAFEVTEEVKSWAENASSLDPENVPIVGFFGRDQTAKLNRQVEAFYKYAEIAQKRDSISHKITSLRRYYWEKEPILSISQRKAFESFNNEIDERYSPLSAQIEDYGIIRRNFFLRDDVGRIKKTLFMPNEMPPRNDDAVKAWKKDWVGIPEAARYARDWDFGPYQVAFEKEIKKLTGTNT